MSNKKRRTRRRGMASPKSFLRSVSAYADGRRTTTRSHVGRVERKAGQLPGFGSSVKRKYRSCRAADCEVAVAQIKKAACRGAVVGAFNGICRELRGGDCAVVVTQIVGSQKQPRAGWCYRGFRDYRGHNPVICIESVFDA